MSALTVWRLCSATYADTAYDGEGAKLYGGRWSPVGLPVAYAAESRALAVLEVLANGEDPARLTRLAWVLVPAEIDSTLIERPARFPESWAQFPHAVATHVFGSTWVEERRSLAVRVPSAAVPGEFNYLINPAHADFTRLKIGKPVSFNFDPRLAG